MGGSRGWQRGSWVGLLARPPTAQQAARTPPTGPPCLTRPTHPFHAPGSASDGDSERSSGRRANWSERLTAPLRFGFRDLLGPLVKLGGAATVSAVGRSTAERLASQLLCQHLRYQAVASAATRAAAAATKGAAAALQRQAALAAAQRGVTSATARYAALRGTLSWLGPLMWGWAALDLAMAALGTDYARLTRAVFVLAQVRLVATQGFTNAPPGERDTGASSAR